MITFGSICTGGGGSDIGAAQAGLEPLWGIDIDETMAYWLLRNIQQYEYMEGYNLMVGDVCDVEWDDLYVDWLHASPPCINASTVKINGKETNEDMEIAKAIFSALAKMKPNFFSLENVPGYKDFTAFQFLAFYLEIMEYNVTYEVIDMSDYEVPQRRKRLILVATKNGTPALPEKSEKKISWDTVIDDSVLTPDTLPDWIVPFVQEAGGKKFLLDGMLNEKTRLTMIKEGKPAFTIKAHSGSKQTIRVVEINGDEVKTFRVKHRGLARLQTLPESYELPENALAASKLIGNAVPPLFMKKLVETNIPNKE